MGVGVEGVERGMESGSPETRRRLCQPGRQPGLK